jgi:ketosteroid isomerase-like protein
MKRAYVGALCLFVFAAVSFGQGKGKQAEQEITKLEADYILAVLKNDVPGIEKIVADDWVIIDAEGNLIDRDRALRAIRSGTLTHQEMKAQDERVRVYGDTAVYTALVSIKGKYAGAEFASKERATDVFVRREGRWQCVLTQTTSYNPK